MKRSGASTEYIQEALGHSNIKTTESYLDSFDKEVRKELSPWLTAFKTSMTAGIQSNVLGRYEREEATPSVDVKPPAFYNQRLQYFAPLFIRNFIQSATAVGEKHATAAHGIS